MIIHSSKVFVSFYLDQLKVKRNLFCRGLATLWESMLRENSRKQAAELCFTFMFFFNRNTKSNIACHKTLFLLVWTEIVPKRWMRWAFHLCHLYQHCPTVVSILECCGKRTTGFLYYRTVVQNLFPTWEKHMATKPFLASIHLLQPSLQFGIQVAEL